MPFIRRARLQALLDDIASFEHERMRLQHQLLHEQARRALAEDGRDFYRAEAVEWKARASRLIDQIGVSSAILTGPVMTEPAAPTGAGVRQVMTALGKQSLGTPSHEAPPPPAAEILGVNEAAVAAAMRGL